jgi:hypothetical protein
MVISISPNDRVTGTGNNHRFPRNAIFCVLGVDEVIMLNM